MGFMKELAIDIEEKGIDKVIEQAKENGQNDLAEYLIDYQSKQ